MTLQLAGYEPEAGPWRAEPLAQVITVLTQRGPAWAAAEAARLLSVTPAAAPGSGPAAGTGTVAGPCVLAVDGRSNAGKTTLAARIAALVPGAAVVHTDDVAWEHSRFGWADLLAGGVLAPARAGAAVRYRPPKWEEKGRPGSIDVPAGCPLLIVEGVGASRRETAHLTDAALWVQSGQHERDHRQQARSAAPDAIDEANRPADGSPPDTGAWLAEEEAFLRADRPWERAGLIACGTPQVPCDPVTEIVVAPPLR